MALPNVHVSVDVDVSSTNCLCSTDPVANAIMRPQRSCCRRNSEWQRVRHSDTLQHVCHVVGLHVPALHPLVSTRSACNCTVKLIDLKSPAGVEFERGFRRIPTSSSEATPSPGMLDLIQTTRCCLVLLGRNQVVMSESAILAIIHSLHNAGNTSADQRSSSQDVFTTQITPDIGIYLQVTSRCICTRMHMCVHVRKFEVRC